MKTLLKVLSMGFVLVLMALTMTTVLATTADDDMYAAFKGNTLVRFNASGTFLNATNTQTYLLRTAQSRTAFAYPVITASDTMWFQIIGPVRIVQGRTVSTMTTNTNNVVSTNWTANGSYGTQIGTYSSTVFKLFLYKSPVGISNTSATRTNLYVPVVAGTRGIFPTLSVTGTAGRTNAYLFKLYNASSDPTNRYNLNLNTW